jgi:hypothetical protein
VSDSVGAVAYPRGMFPVEVPTRGFYKLGRNLKYRCREMVDGSTARMDSSS